MLVIGKGGMSGVASSWSTMKLKESDVDKQDNHPPAQLRNHWTCVQGKYPVVVVVVVVVVGALILSESRSHHVDPLFISLSFKSILRYVFSYISLGYQSASLYILHTLMWCRTEGRRGGDPNVVVYLQTPVENGPTLISSLMLSDLSYNTNL